MIAYKSWDGKERQWNPQNEGFYFLLVRGRIKNADGSYYDQGTLGRFDSVFDVQQAWKSLLCVRPDLKGIVEPVKAPCAFDAHVACVNVERYV